MKHSAQSVTSLPEAPDVERRNRMVRYSIAMAIRVPCLVLIVIFPEHWWVWLPLAIAAVFLPYFAVVVANAGSANKNSQPERPGTIVPLRTPPPSQANEPDSGPRADKASDAHSDAGQNRSGRAS